MESGNGATGNGSLAPSLPSKFNPMEGLSNMDVLNFLDSLQSTLRSSGYTEAQIGEIMPAMQVLAKYNVMALGLGLGVAAMANLRSSNPEPPKAQPPPPQQNIQAEMQPPARPPPSYQDSDMNRGWAGGGGGGGGMGGGGGGGGVGMGGGMGAIGGGMDGMGGVGGPGGGGGGGQEQSFAASIIRTRPGGDPSRMELEMPDEVVSVVLNPKGLGDIKRFSGAHVEVGKGRTAQGFRPVVITGVSHESIRAGRLMIERAINEEFARRQAAQAHQQQQQQQHPRMY